MSSRSSLMLLSVNGTAQSYGVMSSLRNRRERHRPRLNPCRIGAYASDVDLARLNAWRVRFADSKTAAAAFFAVVRACQIVARAWITSSAVAFAGVFVCAPA